VTQPARESHPDRDDGTCRDAEPPTERIKELIRQATSVLISHPDELFDRVDAAVLATQTSPVLADPELIEAICASNHSNLAHWAASNLASPGLPVLVNRAQETVGLARVIARRGIEDTSRVAYGAGQNAAWTVWMAAVFSVTRDADELEEVLAISARSVFDFVERMLVLLREEIERERSQVLSSDNARRLGLINRLLHSGVHPGVAEELRYPIDLFAQTAVVLSARNRSDVLLALIDQVAGAVGPRLRRRPLTVLADADTLWAWFASGDLEGPIDRLLEQAFVDLRPSGVRVAIGPTRPGYDGFRDGHDDAIAAADVAHRDVVTYADVVLATLVRGEAERVTTFIRQRVGQLDREAKSTLSAYLANRCSPTRTAQATFSHRNTVIDRVRRAEARLTVPLEGNELELALALKLDAILGSGAGRR
jgi:DNA-binding PucR family transcriptional regulator